MEEGQAVANLSESDMLASLPLLFTGVADIWSASYRESWRSWAEFRSAARQRWGSKLDLQERLRLEASHCYQQDDESAPLYITCLDAILRRMESRPTVEKQLDLLHENLLPQLKRLLRREDCNTVDDLIDRAVKGEITLEREKSDRTPIPPNQFGNVRSGLPPVIGGT